MIIAGDDRWRQNVHAASFLILLLVVSKDAILGLMF